MLFVIFVFAVFVLCLLGLAKLPNTWWGVALKLLMGFAVFLISIWFVWLAIMVFGVGPAMKKM